MSSDDLDVGGVEREPARDAVLHKGRWKVTNRMVDVDTGEALYYLRELDARGNQTEILTESQVRRIYGDGSGKQGADSERRGDE